MLEGRGRPGLAQELVLDVGTAGVGTAGVSPGKLNGDLTVQQGVLGDINQAHAALAEFTGDAVMREGAPQHDSESRLWSGVELFLREAAL
jgi:hypothetical protein